MTNDAIINPVKGKKSPDLKPPVVMVSSEADLQSLCNLTKLTEDTSKKLMMSKVFVGNDFSLAGPVVSAPYAVMLLETLIAWGGQKFIFFGWCGAISPDVKIGDIIVPSGAIIDEGTSRHYDADENEIAVPSATIVEQIKDSLKTHGLTFHEGNIWTLDAIYRETIEKVSFFQSRNVLAVEMELSALFTVGKFRNADVAGILVVSDELSTFTWQPGFKDERFKQNRMAAAQAVTDWLKEVRNEEVRSEKQLLIKS